MFPDGLCEGLLLLVPGKAHQSATGRRQGSEVDARFATG